MEIQACILPLLYLMTALPADTQSYGDRGRPLNIIYPQRAFEPYIDGNVINVRQEPFNAKGDGVTDDTQDLVAVYDYVLAEMDKGGWAAGGPKGLGEAFIIYMPNGTYLLSDSFFYSGPLRKKPDYHSEVIARIRIVGQDRNKTILRLKDNCPGFGNEAEKPVVSFGQHDFNNRKAFNVFRNITIDTGKGNPGAVGLDFMGANLAEISNVTIRSGDGQGKAGLLIKSAPTVGYHHDITIEGFDYGVCLRANARATHVTMEHISLRDQNKAGIYVPDETSTSIRCVQSDNRAPALHIGHAGAHVVLIDSIFEDGAPENSAVILDEGELFLRNISIKDYESSIVRDNKTEHRGYIDEYVSGRIITCYPGQGTRSLNLLIKDVPYIPWEQDLDQWACPEDYAQNGIVDGQAIQKAFDSGKSTIYFPKSSYESDQPIRVPATVQRITGLYHKIGLSFDITEDSQKPLLVQNMTAINILHSTPRTLVLDSLNFCNYRNCNEGKPAELFVNNAEGPSEKCQISGLKIWVRAVNNEGRHLPVVCENADMWMFGLKTERGEFQIQVRDGGRFEMLGGTFGVLCNYAPEKVPGTYQINWKNWSPNGCYISKDPTGSISIVANSCGFGVKDEDKIITDHTSPESSCVLKAPDFPIIHRAVRKPRNIFIPLYASCAQEEGQ